MNYTQQRLDILYSGQQLPSTICIKSSVKGTSAQSRLWHHSPLCCYPLMRIHPSEERLPIYRGLGERFASIYNYIQLRHYLPLQLRTFHTSFVFTMPTSRGQSSQNRSKVCTFDPNTFYVIPSTHSVKYEPKGRDPPTEEEIALSNIDVWAPSPFANRAELGGLSGARVHDLLKSAGPPSMRLNRCKTAKPGKSKTLTTSPSRVSMPLSSLRSGGSSPGNLKPTPTTCRCYVTQHPLEASSKTTTL